MSREYAEDKIKQVLELTRGNTTQARQQIMSLCQEDMKLLQELTSPHMTGIIAHAIGRVASGKSTAKPTAPQDDEASKKDFGLEILKTIAGGDTAQFGRENNGRPVGKREASQSHIDAIQQMVNKNTSKKS